jgi:hypothetical protein
MPHNDFGDDEARQGKKHRPLFLRQLYLQDKLDDFEAGFEFWKSQKVGSGELTTMDEMLIRWIEGSPEKVDEHE